MLLYTRLIFLCALVPAATGCASYFKRKECEKTNWYQHGYNVAMGGKRLDADEFVKTCQKVEAKMSWTELDTGFKAGMGKYCTSENVFNVGKAGKRFAYEMCDGESEKKMRARYQEGLKLFCTLPNAYRFGASGGIYENVCPSDVEDKWLSEYRKGRKVYLSAVITEKEKELGRLDTEIQQLEGRRHTLSLQQASLTRTVTVRRERVWDAKTGTYREATTEAQDERAKRQAEQLNHDISSVNFEIQRTREKQKTLAEEVSKMRTEMATL